MCLEALELAAHKGANLLDLGSGSGILAIAGLLLGCDNAVGCDIDDKAPDVAMENALLNGLSPEHISFISGDVIGDKDVEAALLQNRYEIVTANIVADVIISLAPKIPNYLTEDGVFICSGIIEGRQDEVIAALINGGLEVMAQYNKGDWYAFVCCKICA